MDDLIERLRAVKWEVLDDAERLRSDPAHECVFVDMRPDDFRALLREAAAALEAAREDALRLDALEAMVNESPKKAFLLHHGMLPSDRYQYVGLGLSNTGRTLRQAIDQARGKDGQEVGE